MKTRTRASRGPRGFGFTISELVVSLTLFGVVMTAALSFLQVGNQGFKRGLDYMSATQNLRQAVGILEKAIQTAGTNLAVGQPEVVFAGEDVMAFNADYATTTPSDPLAVFFEPELEDRVAKAWRKSNRGTIPHSSLQYPDTTYLDPAGLPGSAETLVFYFDPDSTTPRNDDFALFRQVNGEEPELVARNLLRVSGNPFFRYLTQGASRIDSIPASMLPLAHNGPVRGSPADTGRTSLLESVRGVRLTLAATNGREGEDERLSEVTRIVRMPNMGFGTSEVCGTRPVHGPSLSVSLGVSESGETVVRLRWRGSSDDGRGENDIVRYVLWRRSAGSTDWEDPYLSIPAGKDAYLYEDVDLVAGRTYEYAIAAQDCTPTLSSLSVSDPVSVPIT